MSQAFYGAVGAILLMASTAVMAAAQADPAVRDWLSFTADRAFDRTLVVVVGAGLTVSPLAN